MTSNHHRFPPIFRLLLVLLALTAALPVFAWNYQLNVSGNTIIVSVTGLSGAQCCAGAVVDDPAFAGASCSSPCSQGTFTTGLSCNSVGAHIVYVYASDPSINGYEVRSEAVYVSDPAPPTCPQFGLTVAGTKVLTHQYSDASGTTVAYPSGQTADAEIRISLKPRVAPAGTVIYLKVIDPPDGSAYGAPHQAGDNLDPNAGTLSGSSKTTSVTLPQVGTVDVTLKTTQYASGDNYQVEASADPNLASDPNFVCDPNNGCLTTDVITAWKRMYVEMDAMYRNSLLLTERTLLGASVVFVNDRGWHAGDQVKLIHAPSYTRLEAQDVDGFYSEDRTIVDVKRNNDPSHAGAYAITLDTPLQYPYFTDFKVSNTQLGDAIVNLSRNPQHSSDPLYRFNEQYLASAFGDAYVEVIKASSSGLGVPLYASLEAIGFGYVGSKWFAARESTIGPPNFALAIAAESRAPVQSPNEVSLGTTSRDVTYVWRQTVDDATSGPKSKYPLTSGLAADTVSGEVLVHEIAHQWDVNLPTGHCNKMTYDGRHYCQMNSPQNTGQFGDGLIQFHYVGTSPANADSEYITIRKTGEPKP